MTVLLQMERGEGQENHITLIGWCDVNFHVISDRKITGAQLSLCSENFPEFFIIIFLIKICARTVE